MKQSPKPALVRLMLRFLIETSYFLLLIRLICWCFSEWVTSNHASDRCFTVRLPGPRIAPKRVARPLHILVRLRNCGQFDHGGGRGTAHNSVFVRQCRTMALRSSGS